MACESGRQIVCKWAPLSYAFVMEMAAWPSEAVESGDDDDENAETREQHASVNAPAISSRCRVKQRWCIFVVH
eukprot:scaffold20479_cov217-Skeletonema_menzelii.AAC.3